MDARARVLVIDDEVSVRKLMRDFLEAAGYQVEAAANAGEALSLLRSGRPADCVILDVMMPGTDGFDLCREIRASSDVPVLFLSALDSHPDRLRGFRLGADDYIVKSATPDEVVARVAAVLRRAGPAAATCRRHILDHGWLVIDVGAHEVLVRGKPCELPPREFAMLRLLAENPRQVFANDQLIDQIWNGYGSHGTVAVHARRIREKIEADPAHPQHLLNVRGVGYRFDPR